MGALSTMRARGVALLRDDTGNATLEFLILFPFLMFMLLSLGEVGTLMARAVMLDRGLNIAIRDVRLGLSPGISHDGLKTKICQGAFLLTNCLDDVLLELLPVANPASIPEGNVNCVDRTEEVEPVINFNPGGRSEIMFVRACVVVDPIFPGVGFGALLPVDQSGGYAIVTQTAFMNEPG